MSLDIIIPPEIYHDSVYSILINTIRSDPTIRTVVEIGASSGAGSTEALLKGLDGRTNAMLYSIEVSYGRFALLQKRSSHVCLHGSTCSIDEFPSDEEVLSTCAKFGIGTSLDWKTNDILYLQRHPELDTNILARVSSAIDFVLIDGSEFLGFRELQKVYGARYIALDDKNVYKNIQAHQQLLNDENYTCIFDVSIRNGFSIFKKKDALCII